jgi:hypothetical protein
VRKFLYSLFGRNESAAPPNAAFTEHILAGAREVYDPENENDRIGLALLGMLQKQVSLLGLELEQVPPTPPYTSKACRGYLLGVAVAVLEQEGIAVTKDKFIDTVVAAFALVFGRDVGADLAQQTALEFEQPGSGLAQSFMFASQEIEVIYRSGGEIFASGFHLFATQSK